jgi:anti-anti-sigma factor
MNSEITKDNDKFICKLSGLLDTQNSSATEEEILEQIKSCKDFCEIELDMSEVEYITSFFIRVCVSIKKHNKVKEFTITNVQSEVYKIFKLLDLVDKLNISQ